MNGDRTEREACKNIRILQGRSVAETFISQKNIKSSSSSDKGGVNMSNPVYIAKSVGDNGKFGCGLYNLADNLQFLGDGIRSLFGGKYCIQPSDDREAHVYKKRFFSAKKKPLKNSDINRRLARKVQSYLDGNDKTEKLYLKTQDYIVKDKATKLMKAEPIGKDFYDVNRTEDEDHVRICAETAIIGACASAVSSLIYAQDPQDMLMIINGIGILGTAIGTPLAIGGSISTKNANDKELLNSKMKGIELLYE